LPYACLFKEASIDKRKQGKQASARDRRQDRRLSTKGAYYEEASRRQDKKTQGSTRST
jgi:hypothetical protein